MNLQDITPQESTFKLKVSGDRVFTMNPINLSDEIWLDNTFGSEIGKIFESVNIKEISRIVFRLLKNEDKAFFKKQVVELVDENGEASEIELGGVALLQSMISGWDEKTRILEALLLNIGISRPDVIESDDQPGESVEDGEKKSQ